MLSKSFISGKFFWNGKEISKEEYENIFHIIKNKPLAPSGYDYKLTDALQWQMYELPKEEEAEVEE